MAKLASDLNATVNVIDGIDFGLDLKIQTLLAPIYERYPFLSDTLFGIPVANLIAAIITLLFFLLLRRLFTRIIITFLQRAAKHTQSYYDDRIISALKKPLSFAIVIVGLHLFFALIFYETPFVNKMLNSLILFDIFWIVIAVIGALKELLFKTMAHFNPDLAVELGSFLLKLFKGIVGAVGFGAILQVWGIDVTALLASLGLGGLAFALAAKDTAANLFGSFALLADKTVRIGEWIKVGDVEGIVEEIGMRTTKIRSFEKSIVTVPNSIVANTPVENFSRRGVRRIKLHIGITYDTPAAVLREIVTKIEAMLRTHEEIAQKELLMVRFDNFGDSALEIFIYTFAKTANWERYLKIREDILMRIMQIVEDEGSAFAFPSQSLYVEKMPQLSTIPPKKESPCPN